LEKKVGMTSLYNEEGKNVPCTVLQAGPCVVTQIKTVEKDGYFAVQLGFDDKKEKHTTKAELGHFRKSIQHQKETYRVYGFAEDQVKEGEVLTAELFRPDNWSMSEAGQRERIPGCCKTSRLQRRWRTNHGQHNRGRAPGSLVLHHSLQEYCRA